MASNDLSERPDPHYTRTTTQVRPESSGNCPVERGRPSFTAEGAALMRAAHQLLDAVALRLIGADQEAALRANPQVLDRPELRPLRVSIAVRSRYAEDSLREAVRRGVRHT
jgi:hypothetical protein